MQTRAASWSAAAARDILDVGCSALGLNYEKIELIRFGTNAVYRLLPFEVVVRVSRPGYPASWVEREMDATRWLAAHGFPAVAPIASMGQKPFPVYDSVLSCWPWLESTGEKLRAKEFGRLIRSLHEASGDYEEPELEPWDPMNVVDYLLCRLSQGRSIDHVDIDLLCRWHDYIGSRLSDHRSELGEGLIHGDAHIGNTLVTAEGPRLLDFDYACIGPREWDLVPQTLGPRRFEEPRSSYQEFSEAYGFDVTEWSGYRTAVLARELLITCWRLDVDSLGGVSHEGERRLRYWRREPKPPRWKSF